MQLPLEMELKTAANSIEQLLQEEDQEAVERDIQVSSEFMFSIKQLQNEYLEAS